MSRFCVLPARVLDDPRFTSMTHLRVLMALCTRTDKNGWAFVKRKTMGEKVGVSAARVSQCVRDLKAWGYVEVHEQIRDGVQGANHYRVLFDIGLPVEEPPPDSPPDEKPKPAPTGGAVPPVSTTNGGVSGANPPVSVANPGVSARDLPPRKSLVFTPVVNAVSFVNSSSNARARKKHPPVDNFAAAADSKSENLKTERELTELLIALELERGKELTINRGRDRTHVLTWVGKGVTPDQLRAVHALAVAARKRARCDRPTYAGFVSTFINEVIAPEPTPDGGALPEPGEWYRTQPGVDARGAELGLRERKADEDWRYYRVLVARAAREPKAIEFVLTDAQRFNAADLYQFARATFGDALMPVDDYAS
jgi:hypothetical protein